METYGLEEMQEIMLKHLREDIPIKTFGHTDLDEFYKFMQGNVTDITGYPYSGKTLWLNEMLYSLSDEYGKRNLLHLQDAGKPEEVWATLFQKRTGKTFDKRYLNNQIDEPTILKTVSWFHEHFPMLKTLSVKEGDKIRIKRPTPYEFWEFAVSTNYDTASIDSWNYMKHDKSHGNTDYLADVLSYRNELAEKYNKHFYTVIHPSKPTEKNYTKEGRLIAPDIYDLMGGSEWANNAKNVLSVHEESKESSFYDIYVRKTKPRIVGQTGFATFQYDIINQKFYSGDVNNPKFAFSNQLNSFSGLPEPTEQQF